MKLGECDLARPHTHDDPSDNFMNDDIIDWIIQRLLDSGTVDMRHFMTFPSFFDDQIQEYEI